MSYSSNKEIKIYYYYDKENEAHRNGTFDYCENKAKWVNIVLCNSHTLSGGTILVRNLMLSPKYVVIYKPDNFI